MLFPFPSIRLARRRASRVAPAAALSRAGRRVGTLGIASLLALGGAAQAGPTLDEAIARHRAALDPNGRTRGTTPIELDPALPDGITLGVGGPANDVPQLQKSILRGEGGLAVRAGDSFWDGRVKVRFGAAYQPGEDHPATLDGSSASVPFGPGALYASVERRHWGPAWASSLILDGGSRPLPAVGWRKADARPFESRWLSWLGPWSADFFAGELSQARGPRHAKLLGARLQIMPIDGLELGASRAIQWGGKGRPQSARSLWNALIGNDNSEDPNAGDRDPSNQLGGFDARYTFRFDTSRSASAYVQVIGEDEAGNLPSHRIGSYGVDVAWPIGTASVRGFAEYANTTARGAFGASPLYEITYRHRIYTDGYTQLGDPLGHPAGGDIKLGSTGVIVDAGRLAASMMLHAGKAYRSATLYPGGGRLRGGQAEVAWQVDAASRVGLSLMHWREPASSTTHGQLWWQYAW